MKKTAITYALICSATMALYGAALAKDVTYGTDGGALHEVVNRTLLEPARKKLGLDILIETNADRYPVVKTQVLSGKPLWDMTDFAAGYCALGTKKNLL